MNEFENRESSINNNVAEDFKPTLPPLCKVIFYNDDFTTMQFVVDVLVSIFNKSSEEATVLMNCVHENGSSVVGSYTYDIAVSRMNLTVKTAKKNGFPLRVEIEQSE